MRRASGANGAKRRWQAIFLTMFRLARFWLQAASGGAQRGPDRQRVQHPLPQAPAVGMADVSDPAALGRLRIYLRLAHRWRWLSDGQYAHISAMVAEIGRLLGGWLRAEQPS